MEMTITEDGFLLYRIASGLIQMRILHFEISEFKNPNSSRTIRKKLKSIYIDGQCIMEQLLANKSIKNDSTLEKVFNRKPNDLGQ